MLSYPRVTMTHGRRERGLALRAITVLVVWLAVGGHLSGLAHFALISHHVCAAHGELAHGDEGHHGHAAEGEGAPAGSQSSLTTTADVEEEHEHCSVFARRQEPPTAGHATAGLLAPAVTTCLREGRPDSVAHRGESLLTLAPKTSPPV